MLTSRVKIIKDRDLTPKFSIQGNNFVYGDFNLKKADLDKIKKLVIISMFSDDELMELLVLKGGNAIDLIYQVAFRASKDIDFSIEHELENSEIKRIQDKMKRVLKDTFRTEGYEVFDVKLYEKPDTVSEDMRSFWGGYQVDFKIADIDTYERLSHDFGALRRNATVVGSNHKRTFRIDISKFEYCKGKKEEDLAGYTIYVYTPEMILFEKLRAICQQMPEYAEVVINPSQSARARDFFDIFTILETFDIVVSSPTNLELLQNIFEAKRVPIELIRKIRNYREYHRPDFESVKDTVKEGIHLKDFDYYFDYVVDKTEELEALWKK